MDPDGLSASVRCSLPSRQERLSDGANPCQFKALGDRVTSTTTPKAGLSSTRPTIVGVVNVTEDSFSDGGWYLAPDQALIHARRLLEEGADIIELGPAASHPGARPVDADEERCRLEPLIARLVEDGVTVSVDSFLPSTHEYAVSCGATFLNDIQAFPDRLTERVVSSRCHLMLMHSIERRGIAARDVTDAETVWGSILRFFEERIDALLQQGVSPDRLIIDPGLGYFLGSTPQPSFLVLSRVGQLKERFQVPVLVSASRKSFLRMLTGRSVDRSGPATLAAELYAASLGVDYLRTHDIASLSDGLDVLEALTESGTQSSARTSPPPR